MQKGSSAKRGNVHSKAGASKKVEVDVHEEDEEESAASCSSSNESEEVANLQATVGRTFRRSGTGGHQKTTEANNKYGEAFFDQFLVLKGLAFTVASSGESDICKLDLFQELGTYLSKTATQQKVFVYTLYTLPYF